MQKFQFKIATSDDRAAVIGLLEIQLREHSISTSLKNIENAVDGILSDPRRGALLVADIGGRIVGVACLSYIWTIEHGGHSAWLEEFYIMPEYRNQGLGTKFIEHLSEFAKKQYCTAIDLEVESDHQQVEKLYARNGFRKHTRSRWVKSLNPK